MATRSPRRSSAAAPPALDAAHRVVILRGPDAYLRRSHTQRLETLLKEAHGDVERFDYDGKGVDPVTVLDELRTFGLLQDHKLVVVDQADQLLARAGSPSPRELLEAYAGNPVPTATLVLRAETWRPGRLDKAVEKVGAILKCEPPDMASAARWCVARIEKEHAARIAPAAAQVLVERIGPMLDRLDAELGKLAAHAGPGAEVTAEDVRQMVGLSREEKAWQIQSVLLNGDTGRALQTLRELLDVSGQPEQLVLWSMTDLARKLHAASRLLREGHSPGAVRKELRLFGDAAGPILQRAGRFPPAVWADLVRCSLEADRRIKRGIGRSDRTVEALAVAFADTVAG
jgi:DNA polymerase-3 subunit delta